VHILFSGSLAMRWPFAYFAFDFVLQRFERIQASTFYFATTHLETSLDTLRHKHLDLSPFGKIVESRSRRHGVSTRLFSHFNDRMGCVGMKMTIAFISSDRQGLVGRAISVQI
jgi:hypothetical protein